ncbi:MAG: TetR/AcrR family transcriptional regulator [Desulfobacterales bacterium]|nr:TetR/AcrR family transcriptional regulator [Desulfobacterales bacterium]
MELERRVKPKQARAIKTYELILNTAADLLEKVGSDHFTTKLLAEKAGLRIRSIYRYFPNKLAIIKALAERHAKADIRLLEGRYDHMKNPDVNFQDALGKLIDTYYEMQINEPGYIAVRSALNGSPELMEYDEASNYQYSIELAKALKTRMHGIRDEKLEIISMNIIEISDTMIWRAHKHLYNQNNKKRAAEILGELKLVLKSYLANYLD